MSKVKSLLAVWLVVLLCGCPWPDAKRQSEPQGNSYGKINAGKPPENTMTSDSKLLAKGAHYPNLPKDLYLQGIGRTVSLLKEAGSRHEIVAWADANDLKRVLELWSNERWFVVMSDYMSGRAAWMVYLYGYCPLKDEDPAPWKLVYVGSEGLESTSFQDIECVYVDSEARCLVFASSRTGKVTKAIRIDQEVKMLEEYWERE